MEEVLDTGMSLHYGYAEAPLTHVALSSALWWVFQSKILPLSPHCHLLMKDMWVPISLPHPPISKV